MNAPGGPLARFTGSESRRALPKLAGLADRKAALRKAAKAYLEHDRTVLAKRRKSLARRLESHAKEGRR